MRFFVKKSTNNPDVELRSTIPLARTPQDKNNVIITLVGSGSANDQSGVLAIFNAIKTLVKEQRIGQEMNEYISVKIAGQRLTIYAPSSLPNYEYIKKTHMAHSDSVLVIYDTSNTATFQAVEDQFKMIGELNTLKEGLTISEERKRTPITRAVLVAYIPPTEEPRAMITTEQGAETAFKNRAQYLELNSQNMQQKLMSLLQEAAETPAARLDERQPSTRVRP